MNKEDIQIRMDSRNFNTANKIYEVLRDIKGFDVAISNPHTGKILVKHNDTTFVLSLEPVFNNNDAGNAAEKQPFEEILHKNMWRLK